MDYLMQVSEVNQQKAYFKLNLKFLNKQAKRELSD